MNILLAALELSPFSEKQSSAQIVAGLAKALRLLGHEVTLVVPKLPAYEEAGLMLGRRLSPLTLAGGSEVSIFDVQLSSGVSLVLLQNHADPFVADEPLEEQAAALGSFSQAVARLALQNAEEGRPFDVVHAHGAAAGLCLLHLSGGGALTTARVLSVQDASHKGEFPAELRGALGIPEDRMSPLGFESGEGLCLLKGLLPVADAVIAPSESYARQLQAPELHGALARAFQGVQPWGILSGVDVALYNPSTDAALKSRYDAPNPSNKARNKVFLLNRLELEFEQSRPLVFCEYSGESECAFSTLLSALPSLVRNDVALIVSVPAGMRAEFERASEALARHIKVLVEPGSALRRQVLAAADFYLSVRKHDPFGQELQQAARYGAVPIAYKVDAVEDVVVDADAELRTGTGLLYDLMTQRALTAALGRAVSAFRNEAFPSLLRRVMRQDQAWDRAARRHLQIYRQAVRA